ncbi:complement decay-accelerating factor [Sagmatias obliquidens]|uniref:complement decay-accelerating factor n=1 Tax=Sagmatias obliquidens TaxID=3371155 RepID=UPI000F444E5A|nr:complement decay-accelerating factor [Lagenorhynchus obliquidens]
MSPARRSAPVVLRLLGGLAPPLLLLLLRPPAASGDCSLPPDVPNAQPALGALTSFSEQSTVTYKCNKGFVKVPGKADSVVCLNNKWSELAEFCNRSCDVPTRLLFASLKKSYTKQNYFPEGSTVEYDCRLGYMRDHSLSGKLTCLQNFTWSKPDEFCKKKSCANPREIKNGYVSITHDLLFGSPIHFSCNTGYKLVGATSSYCSLAGNTVEWSDPFPECQEILCPEPPEIDHGMIEKKQNSYAYRQSVTYKCIKGFALHGESSINCTVRDDQGEWSGPPPECKGNQFAELSSKQNIIHVSYFLTCLIINMFVTVNYCIYNCSCFYINCLIKFFPPQRCVAGTLIIGTMILVKIFWGSGKSGTYMYDIDSFAYDASNYWLTEPKKS